MSDLDMNTSSIQQRYIALQEDVALACQRAERPADSVKILLATKTVAAETIKEAYTAGAILSGENRVQELIEKADALADYQNSRHFIGSLQTNKIKPVIAYSSCLQSLDRLALAEKLQRYLESIERVFPVMVQVNVSYEGSKAGVAPEDTLRFLKSIQSMENLQICGLMTIGKLSEDPKVIRTGFRLLKHIQQQALDQNLLPSTALELSMGMSHDFPLAILEGATIIRVGSKVFGKRQ